MGKGDFPPSNVPAFVVPLSDHMLEAAGVLWTTTYILFIRSARRDKTYGIPVVLLASNVAWELVYGAYVAEDPLERYAFSSWLLIDLGLIYYTLKYGPNEWRHAPMIQRNILAMFTILVGVFLGLQYSFAQYWIENRIGSERGKTYRGVTPSADIKELNFWSAQVAQAVLSASFIAQLLVRWDNRGHDWTTWVVRTIGTFAGLYGYYAVRWYWWPEMHPYVSNPFAVCLTVIGFGSDLLYGVLMLMVSRSAVGRPSQHTVNKAS
ncbi:hypothetical protein BKA62DRAFT_682876 [Auriculariales sp. MPI-PUGE-AT-0066]|nr:hypothetical protein BKA62DRAFT_682876 [Auriculariales sp. MPI-PUGE-AT-0066]